jgi:NADH-quinone oxidoreductase subunit F/NADP-reducing hydrogenase subunit HndC
MLTPQTLEDIRRDTAASNYLSETRAGTRIVVGMATCGMAAGAGPVYEALQQAVREAGLADQVQVHRTGCIGVCRLEPLVEIYAPGQEKVTYVRVTPQKAKIIVERHLQKGAVVEKYTEKLDFTGQVRIALRNCGVIDPENIREYIVREGYQALSRALLEMSPGSIIEEIRRSGLRGRGGAGFHTGIKWQFAYQQRAPVKYVCCNADEGDPGAFMDRSILEGDPHAVLEAMIIAGYAIGAPIGYIYVRAEYPLAVKRLNVAIRQARELGLLGKDILGSGFDFELELRLGAGAFVCGEETALLTSIEGKRGEPWPRPPFPAKKGLWGQPTVLNNVETYANIARILLQGAAWFAGIGTAKNTGTKVFALGGKINNGGLIEVPMGTTLRDIVYTIGGGIPGGKAFKAAQTGGPSGGCIPARHIDTPIEYEALTALGSMMGSGGLIVMDEDNCMVDVARFFLDFTVEESCGKCPPCRIGTTRMLEILERITGGDGEEEDIEKLETLAEVIQNASLCGLGQSAPNPVLSTLKYFREEYVAHISDHHCPARVCKNFVCYVIDETRCIHCGICFKKCPVGAIAESWDKVYTIDRSICIKCGLCISRCKARAIEKLDLQ